MSALVSADGLSPQVVAPELNTAHETDNDHNQPAPPSHGPPANFSEAQAYFFSMIQGIVQAGGAPVNPNAAQNAHHLPSSGSTSSNSQGVAPILPTSHGPSPAFLSILQTALALGPPPPSGFPDVATMVHDIANGINAPTTIFGSSPVVANNQTTSTGQQNGNGPPGHDGVDEDEGDMPSLEAAVPSATVLPPQWNWDSPLTSSVSVQNSHTQAAAADPYISPQPDADAAAVAAMQALSPPPSATGLLAAIEALGSLAPQPPPPGSLAEQFATMMAGGGSVPVTLSNALDNISVTVDTLPLGGVPHPTRYRGPPFDAIAFVNSLEEVDISSIPEEDMRCPHCWLPFGTTGEADPLYVDMTYHDPQVAPEPEHAERQDMFHEMPFDVTRPDNDPVRTPCCHIFGRGCLIESLEKVNASCPTCRHEFRPQPQAPNVTSGPVNFGDPDADVDPDGFAIDIWGPEGGPPIVAPMGDLFQTIGTAAGAIEVPSEDFVPPDPMAGAFSGPGGLVVPAYMNPAEDISDSEINWDDEAALAAAMGFSEEAD